MLYYYLVGFHLISVMVWISSLFYLQRIIMSQSNKSDIKIIDDGFFIYKKVANPAFLSTIFFGVILISLNKSLLSSGFWIYMKFFFISMIIIIHHLSKIRLKELRDLKNIDKKSDSIHSFAPLVLVAFVVVLTLTKSF